MKAARLHAFHEKLQLEDVPEPELTGPNDVIVKIGAAGVCRTDLHIWEGQFAERQQAANRPLPYSPGHENAGWVEAVGSAVTNVAPGDAVILHPLITCGLCLRCRAGNDMHCDNGVFPGLFADGGFAELMRTSARSLIKLAPNLRPTDVAALADAGLTAYHAVKKAVPLLYPGTRAVVIGAGGLGHIGIQCLAALAPAEMIVVDRSPEALEVAGELGANHTVVVDGGQVAAVMDLTDGRGADVIIDFVGEAGAEQWGVEMMRPGSSLFVIGYGGTLNVPTMKVILEELNFIGNLVGTYTDLVELMVLAAQGKVHLRTRQYPLEGINTAFDDLDHGRLAGARAILVP
ncbi:MAG TPA: NAD(P)-dependent alcohol dehydrogenase [Jiangellaceae bacterium]|nr:NAD(P)-dependent alcohol dehydrogenase [Jiangellaceae bacterium]